MARTCGPRRGNRPIHRYVHSVEFAAYKRFDKRFLSLIAGLFVLLAAIGGLAAAALDFSRLRLTPR